MRRPKKIDIVFVDDKIVAEALSQYDPYPAWGPFWAGEEPLDATTATPEQIGTLVLRTLEQSNNEPWQRPEGWVDDKEVTPAALALGMKDMLAVRGAGAKFVGVELRGETLYVDPWINEGRHRGLRGKQPSIEIPATSSPAELGDAILETLKHSEQRRSAYLTAGGPTCPGSRSIRTARQRQVRRHGSGRRRRRLSFSNHADTMS